MVSERIPIGAEAAERARTLEREGFSSYDALHVAAAEAGAADVLLTTDDFLLSRCRKLGKAVRVSVKNTVEWVIEEQRRR